MIRDDEVCGPDAWDACSQCGALRPDWAPQMKAPPPEAHSTIDALAEGLAALDMQPCFCGHDFRCSRCKGLDALSEAAAYMADTMHDEMNDACGRCGNPWGEHREPCAVKTIHEVRRAIRKRRR